jgi:hypothetical protein
MPDINENNMDDLFRRAAEQYPLRTDSADWNKIARALDEDDDDPAAGYLPDSKPGFRKLWLLLLLIPVFVVGYYSLRPTKAGNGLVKKENAISPATNSATKNEDAATTNEHKKDNAIADAEKEKIKDELKNNESTPSVAADKLSTEKNNTAAKINSLPVTTQETTGKNNFRAVERSAKNSSIPSSYKNNSNKSASLQHKNHRQVQSNDDAFTLQSQNEPLTTNDDVALALQKGTLATITPFRPVINLKDPSQKTSVPLTSTTQATQKKDKTKKNNYFYTGIVAAPDFSTVKMQSIKATGYTVGILLGYKFSSKFAIETGAYFDSKKYYTDGKYFSSKNVPWLNYINLYNVDGWCDMIDVPLNLRYDFSTTKKNTWFAAAGLSTYFMFKENYTYDYEYNGNVLTSSAKYTKGSQNWFSIINVSAGYEHTIGKLGSLRLEPYLKIPLTGMGTGSLPIMSAGLNIGIIHQFK